MTDLPQMNSQSHDYRESYLVRDPEYREYLELAQWIMKRHGRIRYRENAQFDGDYCYAEMKICAILHRFTDHPIVDYINFLAKHIDEDALNLWADDALLLLLVQHLRKHAYKSRVN